MNAFAAHTPYTAPGKYAALLRALPADPRAAAACWRGLTAHYRATPDLPAGREEDKQARWVADILACLLHRSGQPLTQPRTPSERFAGCCRDDALLLVAGLRERGVPARLRIGWAPYLNPDFVHDHVVAEWYGGTHWVRGDPEMDPTRFPFDTMDLPPGTFQTAGEAWLTFRTGTLSPTRYGVAPGLFGGPTMLRDYVIRELAALTGHELLLWDSWGLMHVRFEELSEAQLALLDGVAQACGTEDALTWQRLAAHPDLRVPDEVDTYDFEGGARRTPLRR
ncbi:transglutaminase domain-containing protein [Deinococcus hopiensis]|uniref:Transglutaminase-like enzymes, putative cysteine proteases n=1 Tax=Deinococcus hopiensis KR-140 TaxID=695939 RepID=A0A1W1V8A4_9DEIO|nr:transglutaminase domain-containing protein [Deinococcus hopiensis]SMB89545.1 Transglutaminase-like enzymes, putative cysteine proteases [Deinococcus hopiensis KR-140]